MEWRDLIRFALGLVGFCTADLVLALLGGGDVDLGQNLTLAAMFTVIAAVRETKAVAP